ncbi:helix-turn-helix domain-containing protein [Streptomyces bobili]|uniref:helix-turn-helix domain-containing protein n=1 Tax=Streptomyces bobili TaxID=67280 RepID=UPI0036F88AE5
MRAFRKDAGFRSGRAFAHAAGWHESKVSRLEHGKQRPSEDDVRDWCRLTGREDRTADLIAVVRHVDELWTEWRRQLQDGAESRQRKAIPVYDGTRVFRIWYPGMVWGTLQTREYAAEVFTQVMNYYDIPDDIEAAVAGRLERQRYLHEGDRIFNVLLGEQALYTNFGGPDVMRGQLDRLLADLGLTRLSLGIIPRSAPSLIWPGNSFSMFDDTLVLMETFSSELSVTQPQEIGLFAKAFSLLQRSAVYGDAARALILDARRHYDR